MQLSTAFFNVDALTLAQKLVGKVICRKYQNLMLKARIIETEAYDKASHSYAGFSEKRKAMFMPPGTIYMYYARGHDSFNISAKGDGAAVLIKSAIIDPREIDNMPMIKAMQKLNPAKDGSLRKPERLLSGQTLLCKSLNITVKAWDQRTFNADLFIEDCRDCPKVLIQTTRLGIAEKRDADLLHRFIDHQYAAQATQNPLRQKKTVVYHLLNVSDLE